MHSVCALQHTVPDTAEAAVELMRLSPTLRKGLATLTLAVLKFVTAHARHLQAAKQPAWAANQAGRTWPHSNITTYVLLECTPHYPIQRSQICKAKFNRMKVCATQCKRGANGRHRTRS